MRKKTLIICAGMLGVFMVFMCTGAMAVNPTNNVVTVGVAPTINLVMTGTPVDYGVLAPPTTDTTKVLGVTISSNKAWSLNVSKNQDLTMTKGATTYTIPSANFLYKCQNVGAGVTNNQVAYAPFPLVDTLLASGIRGISRTLDVQYSLTIDWDTEAYDVVTDQYTATHTYTATQP